MLLKKGSSGPNVEKLQRYLGITVDGNFGNKTLEAVMSWQKNNKYLADGILRDANWKKMFGSAMSDNSILPTGSLNINMQIMFKLDKLKGHIPDKVISQIASTAEANNINTVLRLAHFLSQCSHESGEFNAVVENLNYSADGLKKIFPKYFQGKLNEAYARQPDKIANRVYSSRMGNGDELSGDGYRFRGRGYIQLTGKSNYVEFDKTVADDILANPDLVSTKYPLSSAAFFFTKNSLWAICDKGSDLATIKALTKRINGGLIGLDDRIKKFNEYYALLK